MFRCPEGGLGPRHTEQVTAPSLVSDKRPKNNPSGLASLAGTAVPSTSGGRRDSHLISGNAGQRVEVNPRISLLTLFFIQAALRVLTIVYNSLNISTVAFGESWRQQFLLFLRAQIAMRQATKSNNPPQLHGVFPCIQIDASTFSCQICTVSVLDGH